MRWRIRPVRCLRSAPSLLEALRRQRRTQRPQINPTTSSTISCPVGERKVSSEQQGMEARANLSVAGNEIKMRTCRSTNAASRERILKRHSQKTRTHNNWNEPRCWRINDRLLVGLKECDSAVCPSQSPRLSAPGSRKTHILSRKIAKRATTIMMTIVASQYSAMPSQGVEVSLVLPRIFRSVAPPPAAVPGLRDR